MCLNLIYKHILVYRCVIATERQSLYLLLFSYTFEKYKNNINNVELFSFKKRFFEFENTPLTAQ